MRTLGWMLLVIGMICVLPLFSGRFLIVGGNYLATVASAILGFVFVASGAGTLVWTRRPDIASRMLTAVLASFDLTTACWIMWAFATPGD